MKSHKRRKGIILEIRRGREHKNAVLSDDLVKTMRERHYLHQVPMAVLAREHGITRTTAQAAISGRTWQHVAMPHNKENTNA